MRFLLIPSICFILTFSGCGSGLGEQSEFDSLVDEVWLDINAGELKNAVEYLQAGGKHYDIVPGTTVDQDFVIPLCLKLESEYKVECQALLYDDDSLGEFTDVILVKLPVNPADRNGIASLLAEADELFPGRIEQEWGHKWLALNYADAESFD